jgi:hypothetical protein
VNVLQRDFIPSIEELLSQILWLGEELKKVTDNHDRTFASELYLEHQQTEERLHAEQEAEEQYGGRTLPGNQDLLYQTTKVVPGAVAVHGIDALSDVSGQASSIDGTTVNVLQTPTFARLPVAMMVDQESKPKARPMLQPSTGEKQNLAGGVLCSLPASRRSSLTSDALANLANNDEQSSHAVGNESQKVMGNLSLESVEHEQQQQPEEESSPVMHSSPNDEAPGRMVRSSQTTESRAASSQTSLRDQSQPSRIPDREARPVPIPEFSSLSQSDMDETFIERWEDILQQRIADMTVSATLVEPVEDDRHEGRRSRRKWLGMRRLFGRLRKR